jgi:hypothetical protein
MIRPNHRDSSGRNEIIIQYGFLKKQRKELTRKLTGQTYHW